MIKNRLVFALLLACGTGVLIAGSTADLAAHGGATGIVKDRMVRMKAMQEKIKPLEQALKEKAELDLAQLRKAAAAIAEQSEALPTLFPPGSNHKPSEALPAIWETWADFEERFDLLAQKAEALEAAIDSGDVAKTMAAYKAVTEACHACHILYKSDY
ncbi:MAG: c-type cytochrome [Magnetospiraceae bacterium]